MWCSLKFFFSTCACTCLITQSLGDEDGIGWTYPLCFSIVQAIYIAAWVCDLPRGFLDTGDLAKPGSVSECGSVELELAVH